MSILTTFPWHHVPDNSPVIVVLLIMASCVTSTVLGYDGSMMNGLNILPSYTNYFTLTTTTLALNTSSLWLGAFIIPFVFTKVPDYIGRKAAMFWAAVLTLIAVILQASSQNIAMFVISRILIGAGTGASSIVVPVYLAETLPLRWRGVGLALVYDFWYVGGLLAAGITYGTAKMDSTWAWRLPSALQGLFTIPCILLLPFLPESPRWLVDQGRNDEALVVLAKTYANGDLNDPAVLVQHQEILTNMAFEKSLDRMTPVKVFKDIARKPSTRKRMLLVISVAVISMLSGNNIISYYLGGMLDNAGITNSTTQLEINIVLNAFCLVCAVVGTFITDVVGRKQIAIISTALLTFFLFMVGGLTKDFGNSDNNSGIYATVAMIFLFQGSYSIGWTPLTVMYPPEVMNYSMRALGMGVYTAVVNAVGLFVTWVFPYALAGIGWKTYMINGAWDVLELAFVIWFWVETKGKTLEEIDEMFDGAYETNLPTLEAVIKGDSEAVAVVTKKEVD